MAIYRLKSKLFAYNSGQQNQQRQNQRRQQNQQRQNQQRRGRGGSYNPYDKGYQNGQKASQAQINSLTQEKTNLQTQLDAANKNSAEIQKQLDLSKKEAVGLTDQVNSLTEANKNLQNKPGIGTGLAIGSVGTLTGIVGYGAYKSKQAENDEQYQLGQQHSQIPTY